MHENNNEHEVQMLLWNCEGFEAAKDVFNLKALKKQYDLLIFTETFLTEKTRAQDFEIPGFYTKYIYALKNDSGRGRPFRGISIYYNAKMGSLINVKKLENFLIINFEFLTVIGTYLNPKIKKDTLLNELLSTLKHIKHFQNLIFAGDFNCRLDKPNDKTETLLDFMEENSMTLANEAPYKCTYVCKQGTSVIDLIFMGTKIKFLNFKIQNVHSRKHSLVSCKFKLEPKYANLSSTNGYSKTKSIFNEQKLSYLYESQYNSQFKEAIASKNIENFYEITLNLLNDARDVKNLKARISQPWFDTECYQLRRQLNSILHEIDIINFLNLNPLDDDNNNYKSQLLCHYNDQRKIYRKLCAEKKKTYNRKVELRIIAKAENQQCHKILALSKPFYTCNNIPLKDWEVEINSILNQKNLSVSDSLHLLDLIDNEYSSEREFIPIMEQEVTLSATRMKNRKAPGLDNISNENVKCLLDFMLPEITAFFNLCLTQSKMPEQWRHQNLKLLYKGKGDTENKNSYRGISLSSSLYNLLDRIIHTRLYSNFIDEIPNNQFGFVKKRSTTDAIKDLLENVNHVVYVKEKPLYSLFLDLRKAFDLVDRKFIFNKILETKKISKTEMEFLAHSFDPNFLHINDGVASSNVIIQSNGVRQGGCTSPLFFIYILSDINDVIKHLKSVRIILYADDMALISENLEDLAEAMRLIKAYLYERSLHLNLEKCKFMKFRNKGRGKYRDNDVLTIDGVNIERVIEFTYLGVIFQSSGICFTKHIEKRVRSAILETFNIKNLYDLSINTALELFNLKISPIASYGLDAIWPFLSSNDLEKLEKVKSRYFKRVLGLSKINLSRYTYEILDTDLFVNDLKIKFKLSDTKSYEKFFEAMLIKKTEVRDEFYEHVETINGKVQWAQSCFEDRHVFTKYLCHGYHYNFCNGEKFHYEAGIDCKCKFCGSLCSQYHINDCKVKILSLREAARMKCSIKRKR
jgi:hypothetical protein